MKKQTGSTFLQGDIFFFSLLSIVILLCFLFLTPKVASNLFPQKRVMIWQSFLVDVKKHQKLDPRKYWEFREFYSPGYFEFSRDGLTRNQTQDVMRQIDIHSINNLSTFPFLVFHAKYLQSLDFLITKENKELYIPTIILKRDNILFQNKNILIYKENPHIIKLVFILSEEEMKKANGFFDYNDKDKELVKGKYWLNTTRVTLP